MSGDDSHTRRGIDLGLAHLTAWIGFGAINAALVFAMPWPALGSWVRLAHFGFAFGQALAVGLGGWALLARLQRLRLSPIWGYVALAAASVTVSFVTLADDIDHFTGARGLGAYRHAIAGALGLGIPAAALAGRLLARRHGRLIAVAAAAAAAIVNHQILESDYPAAHLYLAWGATTLASWALVGARLPRWLGALGARRRVKLPLVLTASLGGAAAFVVWPAPPVVVEIFENEGAVFFPYLAELRSGDIDAELPLASTTSPGGLPEKWLMPRTGRRDIPASEPRLAPERPIVILLTIDAMRAETLMVPAMRSRLPRMTAIADTSVHFTNVRSAGSSTRNSFGAIFASKHLSALRWTRQKGLGRNLTKDPTPRLPDRLDEIGFTTAHVVSYPPLTTKSRIPGTFERERVVRSRNAKQPFALAHELLDVAIPIIEQHRNEPLFLFMHWMDPHAPYDSAGGGGGKMDGYMRELAACDAQVGRLWDALEGMGVLDRVVLVLAADHGEAFGAHGVPEHGVSLYDVLVRVPLVVRVPGVAPRRVDAAASTLDIAPTLLDLVGTATPAEWLGQSLVGFLRGQTPTVTRPIVGDQGRVISMVIEGMKVMEDRRKHVVEIYDLEADPKELQNLAGSLGENEAALVRQLRLYFQRHRVGAAPRRRVD